MHVCAAECINPSKKTSVLVVVPSLIHMFAFPSQILHSFSGFYNDSSLIGMGREMVSFQWFSL